MLGMSGIWMRVCGSSVVDVWIYMASECACLCMEDECEGVEPGIVNNLHA